MSSTIGFECEVDPEYGKDVRAVMIATVTGRDSGAAVMRGVLNGFPSFHLHGYEAGAGWVHLAEFAQRWLTLRDKMTNPSATDFVHFSQFVSSPRDRYASSPNSDFRPHIELVRRNIKPAWLQFFNMTMVMCGIRKLVIDTYNSRGTDVFGFVHAFSENGARDTSAAPVDQTYSTAQALRSLDFFLRLFPRGMIIIHLPTHQLPVAKNPRPWCVCAKHMRHCMQLPSSQSIWPDYRTEMIKQLNKYHRFRPTRTLMTTTNGDYQNASRLLFRVSSFLGQPYKRVRLAQVNRVIGICNSSNASQSRHAVHVTRTYFSTLGFAGWWMNKLHREKLFHLRKEEFPATTFEYPNLALQRWRPICGQNLAAAEAMRAVGWCASFRCATDATLSSTSPFNTTSIAHEFGSCVACPATLMDWAWNRGSVAHGKRDKTPIVRGRLARAAISHTTH